MRASRDLGNPPDFLSVQEAAMVLRIGRTCAYSLAREFLRTCGEEGLPVVKVGRLHRVPRVALEAMLGGPITWPIESHPIIDGQSDVSDVTEAHPITTDTKPSNVARLFPL